MKPIYYTITDEAPALATASFLPIVEKFLATAGVGLQTRDISLAGRTLAALSSYLPAHQQQPNHLAELGALATDPQANIVKLPNISASIPQLKACIAELQQQGFALPNYPDDAQTEEEKAVKKLYDSVKGSAVNPVLREGNSDRRAPKAVKDYARQNPHGMGPWTRDSRSRVASMMRGDFFENEQSREMASDGALSIVLVLADGAEQVFKSGISVGAGDVVDATFMSIAELRRFLAAQLADAKAQGLLFSIHLKATMMKVSDPILFGCAVGELLKSFLDQYGHRLATIGFNENNGLGALADALAKLPANERALMEIALAECLAGGPDLAMVNSEKGITNLHVPSDVIIDASMPAMIRNSGQMWDAQGRSRDAVAVIPDRTYASIYQACFDYCREHGALNPVMLGSVSNVGLMAQAAEEYGSHSTTFQIPVSGRVEVRMADGSVLFTHTVNEGDVWRLCRTRAAAMADWVKLAVGRADATKAPTIFWLDQARAHDRVLRTIAARHLKTHDTTGLDIRFMDLAEATLFSLKTIVSGADTVSVTGNVLRDYLTDLFPILEVGTSAKMLSIVPLMNGGGLFETGAGGSAPKHVEQFLEEGHLRWDSLGEFMALAASLEFEAQKSGNTHAETLAKTLDAATGEFLLNDKSPQRKAGELDTRGSHFYLCLYWAKAIAAQTADVVLKDRFKAFAAELERAESQIVDELSRAQGRAVNIGGYYRPDEAKRTAAMRPSVTFNAALQLL